MSSRSKPRAFDDTNYELGFMSSPLRVFRSSPTINNEAYINWLDIVEKKKEQIWKYKGMCDLTNLFINGPKYNPNMLISPLYSWKGLTNNF